MLLNFFLPFMPWKYSNFHFCSILRKFWLYLQIFGSNCKFLAPNKTKISTLPLRFYYLPFYPLLPSASSDPLINVFIRVFLLRIIFPYFFVLKVNKKITSFYFFLVFFIVDIAFNFYLLLPFRSGSGEDTGAQDVKHKRWAGGRRRRRADESGRVLMITKIEFQISILCFLVKIALNVLVTDLDLMFLLQLLTIEAAVPFPC